MRCVFGASLVVLAASLAAGQEVVAQTPPTRPQTAAAQPATQGAGGFRIAFVNAGALLRGMPGYAQAESTWTKEAEVADGEAQKIRAAFDSAVAQYQQSQAMLTPSNRTARERQLQAQQDSVQTKLQAIQTRINNRERELLSPMQDRLRAVIDGFRAEGNYALIIDLSSQFAAAVVAYDKALDITLKVASRLAGQSN